MSAVLLGTRRGLSAFLLAGVVAVALSPFPGAFAQAKPLDAPRAAGTAGERFDGFAVARDGAPADVAAIVAKMNAERSVVYAQRAAADKITAAAVGKIYAQQIMAAAPAKTWFLSESGKWSQK